MERLPGLAAQSAAVALGGIYQYNDGRDTPDNLNGIVEYPQKLTVSFEATITGMIGAQSSGIVFMGTGGRLTIRRARYYFQPARQNQDIGEITVPGGSGHAHTVNWLACIRTRKPPPADVVNGHYSAMNCHMMNLAYREKSCIKWRKEWDV